EEQAALLRAAQVPVDTREDIPLRLAGVLRALPQRRAPVRIEYDDEAAGPRPRGELDDKRARRLAQGRGDARQVDQANARERLLRDVLRRKGARCGASPVVEDVARPVAAPFEED